MQNGRDHVFTNIIWLITSTKISKAIPYLLNSIIRELFWRNFEDLTNVPPEMIFYAKRCKMPFVWNSNCQYTCPNKQ